MTMRLVSIALAYCVALYAALLFWGGIGLTYAEFGPDGQRDFEAYLYRLEAFAFSAGTIIIGLTALFVSVPFAAPILALLEGRRWRALWIYGAFGALAGICSYLAALAIFGGRAELLRIVWEFHQGRFTDLAGRFVLIGSAGLFGGIVYRLVRRRTGDFAPALTPPKPPNDGPQSTALDTAP